jgi:acyl-CoA synthetase (AMP-forming)/AMP-acid ligase II
LHLTAGLFSQIADVLGDALVGLRLLLIGGDRVDSAVVARVLREYPPQHWLHCYGPTETTTFAATYAITDCDEYSSLPIGRPIANTRIYLLDPYSQPVPLGAVGEIYIGGAGVARGYLNRPELTAERFVVDPFCKQPGGRMYRSGDLARYRADGNLEFLGRRDHQVKIRGFRIELGEIEARLSDHPAVREAVVIVREDAEGDKRLTAYVTAREEAKIEVSDLREHLAHQLPEYMVPAAFVRLEQMPLTPNGKLDRKALPAPDAHGLVTHTYEPPQGEIEQTLAAIWSQLLGIERIGRNDNFFELGGHSLLAVEMSERLHHTGLNSDVRALFVNPTLSSLARASRKLEKFRL